MKTSPEALAIACFAFVTGLLLGGWQGVSLLTGRLFGAYMPGASNNVDVLGAVVVALLALGAVLVALRVAPLGAAWAGHVAGAAMVLGSLVVLASLVSMLATLVHQY